MRTSSTPGRTPPALAASRWTLRLDGAFLAVAGSAAVLSDVLGHFAGAGPSARTLGSPYTIGAFEAHGLAVLLGVFLLGAAGRAERRPWHALAFSVHLLLGGANLLFWSSFLYMDVLAVGVVTTALHAVFAGAQAVCLWRERRGAPPRG